MLHKAQNRKYASPVIFELTSQLCHFSIHLAKPHGQLTGIPQVLNFVLIDALCTVQVAKYVDQTSEIFEQASGQIDTDILYDVLLCILNVIEAVR